MIKRGTTELGLFFEHPEVDLTEEVIVKLKWVYVPEIPASPYNDFGEPYDFTYDVEVLKCPNWLTLDDIENRINEMNIFDLMNS